MAKATVNDIAMAIQTQLQTITGLRTAAFLTDTLTPPVAMVAIETVEYHHAFAGGDAMHRFTIHLLVSRASDRAGVAALEGYMSQSGATSIRAALEADPTFGGVVDTSICQESGPPAAINVGTSGAVYLWCPFRVIVHA